MAQVQQRIIPGFSAAESKFLSQNANQLTDEQMKQVLEVSKRAALEAGAGPLPFTPKPPSSLSELTGGLVTREAAMAVGGVAGGTIAGGAAAGTTGPAAPFAVPGAVLAGGSLGVGAASAGYDNVENFLKFIGVLEGEQVGVGEISSRAAEETFIDATFGGALTAAGRPLLAGRRIAGRVFGVSKQKIDGIVQRAKIQGISLGAIDVGAKGARLYQSIAGIFPWTGTPAREFFVQKQAQATRRFSGQSTEEFTSVLDELSPTEILRGELGLNMERLAGGVFDTFTRSAARVFTHARKLTSNASTAEIIPTVNARSYLAISGKEGAEEVIQVPVQRSGQQRFRGLPEQKAIAPDIDDPVQSFFTQLEELPEYITMGQYRGLIKKFKKLVDQGKFAGWDVQRVAGIKEAMEKDLQNLRYDVLPEGEAEALKQAWETANNFYAKGIVKFQSATAQKFIQLDQFFFRAGAPQPGTLNADELANVVVNLKSPEGLKDLRLLIGDDGMNAAARLHVSDAYDISMRSKKLFGDTFEILDPDAFLKNLGVIGRQGRFTREGVAELMRTTGIGLDGLVEYARVVKQIADVKDPLVFATRRVGIGGASSILGTGAFGATLFGQGQIAIPLMLVIAARFGNNYISDPKKLKLMTDALDLQLSTADARQAMLRFFRLGIESLSEERQIDPNSMLAEATRLALEELPPL